MLHNTADEDIVELLLQTFYNIFRDNRLMHTKDGANAAARFTTTKNDKRFVNCHVIHVIHC